MTGSPLNNAATIDDQKMKVEQLLSREPELNVQTERSKTLEIWQDLGPLTIDFFYDNHMHDSLDFKDAGRFIRYATNEDFKCRGQYRRDTMTPHGIVRLIYSDNTIVEAKFEKDGLTSFGRKIYPNGDFYVG